MNNIIYKNENKSNSRKYIFNNDIKEKNNVSNNTFISTVTTIEEFKDFFKAPWNVYKGDNNWVAPFWIEYKSFFKKKNPYWTHSEARLFNLYRNKKIVGRIAAIIDYLYCKTYKENIGFFGFFECIEDYNCSKSLLECAQNWLKSKDMKVMRGPINGRVDIGCGFLENGYDLRTCFLSPYAPNYYISFIKKFGMKKERNLLLYYLDLNKPLPKELQEKAESCSSSGIKIRHFNRFRTKKEVKWWANITLESFADHWGHIPVSIEEMKNRFGVKQMRWIVDSSLFLIAEYNGKPVGYIWSTPDYNQIFQKMNGRLGPKQIMQFLLMKKRINMGKLPLICIKKDFRNQNIASYLNYLTLIEMKKRGYVGAEIGWTDESNTSAHSIISTMGAKLYKKLCVFDKQLVNI